MFRKQLVSRMAGIPESIWLKGKRQKRSLERQIVRDVEYHTKESGSEFYMGNGESPKVLIRGMTTPNLVFQNDTKGSD